jgi:hypothetical protein
LAASQQLLVLAQKPKLKGLKGTVFGEIPTF